MKVSVKEEEELLISIATLIYSFWHFHSNNFQTKREISMITKELIEKSLEEQ